MAGSKKGKKANTGSAKREEARRRRTLAEDEEADYLEPCPEVESTSSGSSKDASSAANDPEYDLLEKFASEHLGRTLSEHQLLELCDKSLPELCRMASDCEPGSAAESQMRAVIHRLYPFEVEMCQRLTGQMATAPRDILRPTPDTPDMIHRRYASLMASSKRSPLAPVAADSADPADPAGVLSDEEA